MYELVGIMVGLIVINAIVSLLMIGLLVRCYCMIKEDEYDFRKIVER